jgi:hypothetical protein
MQASQTLISLVLALHAALETKTMFNKKMAAKLYLCSHHLNDNVTILYSLPEGACGSACTNGRLSIVLP